jgi:hypothetical protein
MRRFILYFLLVISLLFGTEGLLVAKNVEPVAVSVVDTVVVHDTVYFVVNNKRQERKAKRVYKKNGKKRSNAGKVVHEVFEFLKLLIPFLHLL